MSKNIAIIDDSGIVLAINVCIDSYQPGPNELLVTNPAYVGGDYVEGYFYSPRPFPSWNRDGKGNWIAPVALPEDAGTGEPPKIYTWDENTLSWS
jgi:hypothetical protein